MRSGYGFLLCLLKIYEEKEQRETQKVRERERERDRNQIPISSAPCLSEV